MGLLNRRTDFDLDLAQNIRFKKKLKYFAITILTIISLTQAYPSGSYCAQNGDIKIEIHVKSTNFDARIGEAECRGRELRFSRGRGFDFKKSV